jgi:hypothetical protein
MLVRAQVTINGTRGATWAAISDIENSQNTVRGIEKIEVIKKPVTGLVGLKWRETRMLFGKPTTVEKRITDSVEKEFYKTRAEDSGFVFITTRSIAETDGGVTLSESHESKPQSILKKLQVPMLLLFRGVIKKSILQDLNDIKVAVEKD